MKVGLFSTKQAWEWYDSELQFQRLIFLNCNEKPQWLTLYQAKSTGGPAANSNPKKNIHGQLLLLYMGHFRSIMTKPQNLRCKKEIPSILISKTIILLWPLDHTPHSSDFHFGAVVFRRV